MLAAAAYLRVSTHQQDWKLQRDAIGRASKARGDRIPPALWFEEKKSGGSLDRPALARLREAVRGGEVGRIYVFKIDRLNRSGIRDTLNLVEEFRRGGAELVTIADGFDLSGPAPEVVLAVMAWAAQMERSAIGDRIRAARARVEASGGRWGRPRRIDPATLEEARTRARRGESLRAIAVAMKIPRSTLADALAGKGHYAPNHESTLDERRLTRLCVLAEGAARGLRAPEPSGRSARGRTARHATFAAVSADRASHECFTCHRRSIPIEHARRRPSRGAGLCRRQRSERLSSAAQAQEHRAETARLVCSVLGFGFTSTGQHCPSCTCAPRPLR